MYSALDSAPGVFRPLLFTREALEEAYLWITKLREEYSPHSDIWRLRRDWNRVKEKLLSQLNDGSYTFEPLDRLEFEDGSCLSLWSSQDMIALKLISQILHGVMAEHIPLSCTHVKGHGGGKQAVQHTYEALPKYRYLMRSDIQSYYDSIQFDILLEIIESYVSHPILVQLIRKACTRIETRGGIFYTYETKGIPKGSPLSPLLGALALLPLDQALGKLQNVFYQRYMDDWIVLTKSKTALRKVIKLTHQIIQSLKLRLHPLKTYIGKISKGFNFLGYYMDDQKILPSKESIRRVHERSTALYEDLQAEEERPRHRRHKASDRDISEYPANEEAPTSACFREVITHVLRLASHKPEILAKNAAVPRPMGALSEIRTCDTRLCRGVVPPLRGGNHPCHRMMLGI